MKLKNKLIKLKKMLMYLNLIKRKKTKIKNLTKAKKKTKKHILN